MTDPERRLCGKVHTPKQEIEDITDPYQRSWSSPKGCLVWTQYIQPHDSQYIQPRDSRHCIHRLALQVLLSNFCVPSPSPRSGETAANQRTEFPSSFSQANMDKKEHHDVQ